MRGILVCKDRVSNPSKRFFEEANKLGIDFFHWDDYVLNTTCKYDFAIFRNMKQEYQVICPKVKFQFNDFAIASTYKSQINQMMNMNFDLPNPLTYIASTESSYKSISQLLGPVFIAKNPFSTQSTGVYLIHNESEFDKVKGKVDIFQQFIETSKGADMRIFLIGGEVITAVKRTNPNNWRSSLLRSCDYEVITVPSWLKDCLYVVKDIYGIDVCAIDLLYGKHDDDLYFLDANVCPSLVELEKVTGLNITGEVMNYCYKTVSGGI